MDNQVPESDKMREKKLFSSGTGKEKKRNGDENIILRDNSLLSITVAREKLVKLDEETISWKYYNSFNFSKMASAFGHLNMSIGITSANNQDGKSLVAANMAVSLTRGYQRRTVIVDMNFQNPSLHKIFGSDLSPGVAEAIQYNHIRVKSTAVQNLFLMTAGDCMGFKPGIEHTMKLRDILNSLKEEFDFVIVDMCSILPVYDFPAHFANEIDGLITVVNTKKTKKEDLQKVFKHLDERRFIGYIFNRVD